MPYTQEYLVDNQVIFQKTIGNYTIEEVKAASQAIADFADKAGRPIYIIGDTTAVKSTPTDMKQVREASRVMLVNPNVKLISSYGSSDKVVVNFLVNMLSGLFKMPFKQFATEKEAIDFVIKQAPHLDGKLQKEFQELKAKMR